MENPYQSPEQIAKPDFGDFDPSDSPGVNAGLILHVPTVAILMIVQGVLSILMGGMLLAMAAFMPTMIAQGKMPDGETPEQMFWIMSAMYGGMGLTGLIPGCLQVFAGIMNYRYKSRILGIIAAASAGISLLTCYCGFTGVAMMIYGLVVLLNPSVRIAFDMRKEGYTKNQIIGHFFSGPQIKLRSDGPPGNV